MRRAAEREEARRDHEGRGEAEKQPVTAPQAARGAPSAQLPYREQTPETRNAPVTLSGQRKEIKTFLFLQPAPIFAHHFLNPLGPAPLFFVSLGLHDTARGSNASLAASQLLLGWNIPSSQKNKQLHPKSTTSKFRLLLLLFFFGWGWCNPTGACSRRGLPRSPPPEAAPPPPAAGLSPASPPSPPGGCQRAPPAPHPPPGPLAGWEQRRERGREGGEGGQRPPAGPLPSPGRCGR